MTCGVVAVGIDGPNTDLVERWLKGGELPVIASLMAAGASGRHRHRKSYRNDRCWDIFLSGRNLESTGATFIPGTYEYFNDSLQREDRYAPFYSVGEAYRSCIFDLPATLSDRVNGIQVMGWGAELNVATPVSTPPHLIHELNQRFGMDPKLSRSLRVLDHNSGEEELSWVVPCLYDRHKMRDFRDQMLISVQRRTDIILDLLARERWDLFLGLYPETHTVNHILWHMGEDHPLRPLAPPGRAQLDVLKAIDFALGRIRDSLPEDVYLMVYTIDHTAINNMDVPTLALLPELLYRWNNPGDAVLTPGDTTEPPAPRRHDYRDLWKHEVWNLVTARGRQLLESPARQERMGDPMSWSPANWYRGLWPAMRAFALPSVSDGHIRLNIKGREGSGLVEPCEYGDTLNQLEIMLGKLVDPRTGHPAVSKIRFTRHDPFDSPGVPPDIIVSWSDQVTLDCVDSPGHGRVGPLPFFRSGGHVAHGATIDNLYAVQGPGIPPGSVTPPGRLEDMPATILHLMGARGPAGISGKSLLDVMPTSQAAAR